MDEYRADIIAARTVAALYTVPGENGRDVPAGAVNTAAISFLGCVVDDLTALHPALPDTVDRYRKRLLPLDEMWTEVQRATEQGLNLLAHAQAVLDASFPVRRNILSLSEFQSRASELYFRALWEAIRIPLVRLPVLPSARDHASHEPALLALRV